LKTAQNHITLILLLAVLSSVTPLAIDAYLPSMPTIAQDLGVKINKIELTISIFLIFFAIGQLSGGILSDRLGRKKTALLGLFGFCISSFSLFFSNSLESLYLFRATQAFFGAMATVNSAAIVRDLFHGKEAAKIFSAIASIMMIAPMIAPALGSLVISFFTWNYIFLFLGIYSLIVLVLIYFKLPITGVKSKTKIKEAYKRVLTHKKAMGYILAVSFGFSGMFIFIEKSSFIYMEYFLISKEYFPLFFGANVLMMIILTKVSMKLIQTIDTRNILKFGIILQLIAGLALVVFSFDASIYTIFASMVLYVGSLGFIFGNAMALALDYFKEDAGVANSVIGVTEFTIAGIIGFLASLIHSDTLTPVFLMMVCTSALALLSLRLSK
jgi:DHA1 family bicyclomycin/chloramphenicol resistance-like MFS transporter